MNIRNETRNENNHWWLTFETFVRHPEDGWIYDTPSRWYLMKVYDTPSRSQARRGCRGKTRTTYRLVEHDPRPSELERWHRAGCPQHRILTIHGLGAAPNVCNWSHWVVIIRTLIWKLPCIPLASNLGRHIQVSEKSGLAPWSMSEGCFGSVEVVSERFRAFFSCNLESFLARECQLVLVPCLHKSGRGFLQVANY